MLGAGRDKGKAAKKQMAQYTVDYTTDILEAPIVL